jgi:hypothetical protein
MTFDLKPTHKPVQTLYSALEQFDDLGASHEGAVKSDGGGEQAPAPKL